MYFNSLKYVLFLPVVYLLFYSVGDRARWFVLLAASLLFYATLNMPYLLIVLVLVAMATYGFGIWLDEAESTKAKLALLWGGIAANILILVIIKYLPFISGNLKTFSNLLSLDAQIQPIKVFVSIGVSYYIFQAISYLSDIYLDIEKPERHFGYFALYLAFFPKLLQGPIERAGDLLPQLKTEYGFNYDNMRFGMLLFVLGLFKKVVIADRLGLYVDVVYNDVHAFTGLPLLMATYTYALQIYMDFSGYTDMALGSARLFNINLTQNFNSPYFATSVADFWRRWHITFSRWILDYIFKPLQMHLRNWKNWGNATALIAAFCVSGIWHGASWGFLIWGGLHGLYMACSVFYKPYQKRLHKLLGIEKSRVLKIWQILVTFNLVSFAWVFFRASNIEDAQYIATNMMNIINSTGFGLLIAQGKKDLIIALFSLFCLLVFNSVKCNAKINYLWDRYSLVRWTCYNLLLLSVILLQYKSTTSFIYFNF
ncbi:MAG TPA: MBOAT family O-acyltransferase [Desulfuromonadaceae bacterium]|jgi:D-alanyl-lipoteichoic acid acyltransferase DltB (MBOAT superfamily)